MNKPWTQLNSQREGLVQNNLKKDYKSQTLNHHTRTNSQNYKEGPLNQNYGSNLHNKSVNFESVSNNFFNL